MMVWTVSQNLLLEDTTVRLQYYAAFVVGMGIFNEIYNKLWLGYSLFNWLFNSKANIIQ